MSTALKHVNSSGTNTRACHPFPVPHEKLTRVGIFHLFVVIMEPTELLQLFFIRHNKTIPQHLFLKLAPVFRHENAPRRRKHGQLLLRLAAPLRTHRSHRSLSLSLSLSSSRIYTHTHTRVTTSPSHYVKSTRSQAHTQENTHTHTHSLDFKPVYCIVHDHTQQQLSLSLFTTPSPSPTLTLTYLHFVLLDFDSINWRDQPIETKRLCGSRVLVQTDALCVLGRKQKKIAFILDMDTHIRIKVHARTDARSKSKMY